MGAPYLEELAIQGDDEPIQRVMGNPEGRQQGTLKHTPIQSGGGGHSKSYGKPKSRRQGQWVPTPTPLHTEEIGEMWLAATPSQKDLGAHDV